MTTTIFYSSSPLGSALTAEVKLNLANNLYYSDGSTLNQMQQTGLLDSMTPYQFNAGVSKAFEMWTTVGDIKFSQGTGSGKHITFANWITELSGVGVARTLAYGGVWGQTADYYLFTRPDEGAIITNPTVKNWGVWTIAHEVSHVVISPGHPVEGTDDMRYSIMSYPNNFNGVPDDNVKVPLTLGMGDMSMLTSKNMSHNNGNTTYSFTENTVNLSYTTFNINPGKAVMTIWDGGGSEDTIDASKMSGNVYITLEEGMFSAIGTGKNEDPGGQGDVNYNVGIAKGAKIENAKGGDGEDFLKGNDLDNKLDGGKGIDRLEGGDGNDTYEIKAGESGDTILDEDGKGSIKLADSKLGNGYSKQKDSLTFDNDTENPTITYTVIEGTADDLKHKRPVTLKVTTGGDTVTIEEFHNGDLGIYLDYKDDPEDPASPNSPTNQIPPKTGQAGNTPSPIIVDLDGDGVETIIQGRGVYFDHNANGKAESTGWVGKDDGLLVRDLNNNGKIDSGRELFGSETLLANGTKAANGFEALAEFDLVINGGNGDGQLDAQDAAYNTLNIWQDSNSNGQLEANELKTLLEAGIQSLNLGYTETNYTIPNPGFGNTNIGWQKDEHGNEHRQLGTNERSALLNNIIYQWAGVENVDPTSRAATMIYGNAIGDARKLEALATTTSRVANDDDWRVMA